MAFACNRVAEQREKRIAAAFVPRKSRAKCLDEEKSNLDSCARRKLALPEGLCS